MDHQKVLMFLEKTYQKKFPDIFKIIFCLHFNTTRKKKAQKLIVCIYKLSQVSLNKLSISLIFTNNFSTIHKTSRIIKKKEENCIVQFL